jgi:perosamine synthetase
MGMNSGKRRSIPFAAPTLGEEEAQAAREAVLSGVVTQGPRVREFERAFASYTGAAYACAVTNCTTALHLALKVAGVQPGDVVLTVSHSFIASANVVRYCQAEPVFVDIDPETINVDPEKLAWTLEDAFEDRGGDLRYQTPDNGADGQEA